MSGVDSKVGDSVLLVEQGEAIKQACDKTIDATFVAGPLGLNVTNRDPNFALCVTKAEGQAAEHGILIDDEIISLNDKDCRGMTCEEFKKLIVGAGRPFKLSVLREQLVVEDDENVVEDILGAGGGQSAVLEAMLSQLSVEQRKDLTLVGALKEAAACEDY